MFVGCEGLSGQMILVLVSLIISLSINLFDRRQVWRRVKNGGSGKRYKPDEYDRT